MGLTGLDAGSTIDSTDCAQAGVQTNGRDWEAQSHGGEKLGQKTARFL